MLVMIWRSIVKKSTFHHTKGKLNMSPVGIIIGVLVGALFTGFFIWLIARISSLIEVSGFGPAYIAAIVIAILEGLVKALLGSTVGASGSALINWIISAIILLLAGRMVKGMKVNGFGSALLAAAVIALFDWLVTWILIGLKF
jgi:putative membrane protein